MTQRNARCVSVLFDRVTGDVINGEITDPAILPGYNTERVAIAVMTDQGLKQRGAIYYFVEGEPLQKVYSTEIERSDGQRPLFFQHGSFTIRDGSPSVLCETERRHIPQGSHRRPHSSSRHQRVNEEDWRLFNFGGNAIDRSGFQTALGVLNNMTLRSGKFWVRPENLLPRSDALKEMSLNRCVELSRRVEVIDPDKGVPLPIQTFYLGIPTDAELADSSKITQLTLPAYRDMLWNKFNALIRAGKTARNIEITDLWRHALARTQALSRMGRAEAETGLISIQETMTAGIEKHKDTFWKLADGQPYDTKKLFRIASDRLDQLVNEGLPHLCCAKEGKVSFSVLGTKWEDKPDNYFLSVVTGSPVNIVDTKLPMDFYFPKRCPQVFCE